MTYVEFCLMLIVGVFVVIGWAVITAPTGYEDDCGYHKGEEP